MDAGGADGVVAGVCDGVVAVVTGFHGVELLRGARGCDADALFPVAVVDVHGGGGGRTG